MRSSCGNIVQNLRMNAGKKCVRSSPVSIHLATLTVRTWISTVSYPQASPRITPLLSTSKSLLSTPATLLVIPTFHSTYNNHHQLI